MCHWVLRVWKCGDSFCEKFRGADTKKNASANCTPNLVTKYSSCSFDRAVHDPANLLNPLHPSIRPIGASCLPDLTPAPAKKSPKPSSKNALKRKSKTKSTNTKDGAVDTATSPSILSRVVLPTIDLSAPGSTEAASVGDGSQVLYPRNAQTGRTIPIPLSEIGKASRFGDKSLGEMGKCNVFEVVLQTKETTMCPACARSPRRAKLPAHARGCFGPS